MKKNNMEKLLKERIIKLSEDFNKLNTIAQVKNKEVQEFKKEFSNKSSIEDNIKNFSNLVADFTLFSRDSQITFTELFVLIKLYKELNFEDLPNEIVELYNTNERFFPRTLFVVREDGIVEKEEGSLEIERNKFLDSPYLKNLINAQS